MTEEELQALYSSADSGSDQPNEVAAADLPEVLRPSQYASRVRAPSRAEGAVRGAQAFVLNAADAATFGLSRTTAGVVNALGSLGQAGNFADIRDKYQQGFEATDQYLRKQREMLPLSMSLMSELVGVANGPAKAADVALDRATRKFAPTATDKLSRLAKGAAAGYFPAALDNYMRTDQDLSGSLVSGAIDAAVGSSLGMAASDIISPAIKRAWTGIRGLSGSGSAVDAITGKTISTATDGGPTIGELYDIAQNLKKAGNEGADLLNSAANDGGDMSRRFYNALIDKDFKDIDPRTALGDAKTTGSVTKAEEARWKDGRNVAARTRVAKFMQTQATLDAYAKTANKRAADDIDSIFAGTLVPRRAYTPSEQAARSLFNDLSRELPAQKGGPIPVGATPVDNQKFVRDAQTYFENEVVGAKLENTGSEEEKVWNAFNNPFRGKRQEAIAKDVGIIPVTKAVSKMSPEELAAIYPAELPLRRYYAARKELADLLTPEGRISGNPVTKNNRRMITKMLRYVDDKIAETVGDKYGVSRADFARVMRDQEIEDLGKKMYMQRSQYADTTQSMHTLGADSYGERLEDVWDGLDARDQDSFKQGWTRGIVDRSGEFSVLGELKNFYGSNDNNLLTETAGRSHMRMIMGDDQADTLERIYNTHNTNIIEANELADLFRNKTTGEVEPEFRGITMTPADLQQPATGVIGGTLSLLKRIVRTKDADKVDALQRLMTLKGPALAKALERGIENVSPGPSTSLMVRGAALGLPTTSGTGEGGSEDDASSIAEYLRQVGQN